jgi:hypothetical protein
LSDRHIEIANKIAAMLSESLDGFAYDTICVRDYVDSDPLGEGIIVSPSGETELPGTNERDDLEYITTVVRSWHALNDDDMSNKSNFRDQVRRIFHHKRLTLPDSCVTYNRIETGTFAIPEAWTKNNTSVTAVRVMTTVRETRTEP